MACTSCTPSMPGMAKSVTTASTPASWSSASWPERATTASWPRERKSPLRLASIPESSSTTRIRDIVRPPRRSRARQTDRYVDGVEQRLVAERFHQKSDCTTCERAGPRLFVGVRRDEDDRDSVMGGDQPVLQLDPTHARHPDIQDQACQAEQLARFQELGRRCECLRPETH